MKNFAKAREPFAWIGSFICRFVFTVFVGTGAGLPAKTSEWQDLQGTHFRGTPIEVLGPFALFKTSGGSGRRMLLRGMSAEDCLRFYEETASRPPRAARWADAKGEATSEVIGRSLQMRGREIVPADLTRLPEPQVLLALYGSHNEGEAWTMLDNVTAVYNRIQRVYPGLLGAVFLGVRHTADEHRRMMTEKWIPWLVADFHQEQAMSLLARFVPPEGTNMVLLSRDGVPLLSGRATDLADTRRFADQLAELLALIDPANPHTWKDRVHYLQATRPREFAHGAAAPVLVGNPLRADGLRQRGVRKIVAQLQVAADGTVVPVLSAGSSDFPPALAAPLTEALRAAVVVPAIDHGNVVAGTLDFVLEVPPENRQAAADALWLSGEARAEVPIPQWLVLRPIKVAEQDFGSEVDHETESGVVVYKAMEVSDFKISRAAQLSAFNSDWFAAAGAASVLPKEGDKQPVDGVSLTWQKVKAVDGLVDLQTGLQSLDFTVGYAWTEFTVPADMEAWLGIGSDDGLKIWLNGELVHDKWIRRMSRIDDDVVPLRLRKGPNRMLLKIQNATGAWSFLYRLRTRSLGAGK